LKNIIPISFLTIALITTSNLLYAPPPPPAGGGAPPCWPPPCIPIDGGISVLVALGIGIGAKTLSSKSQN